MTNPHRQRLVLPFLVALFLASLPATAQEQTFEMQPYAVTSDGARQAASLAARGEFRSAAKKVALAGELPESVRLYWSGRLLLDGGKRRKATKALRQVVEGDSVLVSAAALTLGELALKNRRYEQVLSDLEIAAQDPAFCARAYGGLADAYAAQGNDEASQRAFLSAMECTPRLADRRKAVLLRSGSDARSCRSRLLHQAYFRKKPDRSIVTAVTRHWDDNFDDVALLRQLLRGGRSSWRKALGKLKSSQHFEREMLLGLIAKQKRKKKKVAALVHFEKAERLASSGLREAIAHYFKARTLESLDRDLEASDIYRDIVMQHPEFPLARAIGIRLAEIALREGQPLQGMAALSAFLGTACPGEDLAQGLHLAAFTAYLAGDWEAAATQWGRLASSHFFVSQSPWVKWGPLALFWQAKAELAAGREEAARSRLSLLVRVFPGDYYGVLAGYRLSQMGIEVEPPAPARYDLSPVAIASQGELPATYGAVVELFRMGYWQEAHDGCLQLIGLGLLGPASGDLLLSSYVRANSMRATISYRRSLGMFPAPWRQGARMWRTSLPFDYGEAVQHGHDRSGLDSALTAAIIRFESNYNPGSYSHAGAIGLLQVKRNTGNAIAVDCLGQKRVSGRDLRDPMRNLELGSLYIRELIHRHHDNWAIALAAYNAGPGTASWWLGRFAGLNSDAFIEQITYPNTVGYVKRILGTTPMYWSMLYPMLGATSVVPELPLSVPRNVRPFLDSTGGRCIDDGDQP